MKVASTSYRRAARASLAAAFGLAMFGAAAAQSPQPESGSAPPSAGGLRDPYVTSTGETVDRPGQSQSGGTTQLDRGIQRENNRIDNSICRGC